MTEFCPIYWFSSPLCLNSFVRVIPPLFKKCVFSFFKISGFSVKSGTALLSNVEHGAALETNTIDRQEERRTTTHTHLTHAIWWRVHHSVDVFNQTQHLFFLKTKQNLKFGHEKAESKSERLENTTNTKCHTFPSYTRALFSQVPCPSQLVPLYCVPPSGPILFLPSPPSLSPSGDFAVFPHSFFHSITLPRFFFFFFLPPSPLPGTFFKAVGTEGQREKEKRGLQSTLNSCMF